jgi:hypothetical protein
MANTTVKLRISFSDKVRKMKVGDAILLKQQNRSNAYKCAILAFPLAKFRTQKQGTKIYLFRVA